MTNSASSDRPTNSDRAARFERSARFWMRAYPLRWRETFGADLFGVLADVTEPDAKRVSAAEAAQIVRAGWACRWREHPPLWNWLLYRFLAVRLPPGYRWWAVDDLRGKLWVLRDATFNVVLIFWLFFVLSDGLSRLSGSQISVWLLFLPWIAILLLMRKMRIRAAWYRFVETEPPPEFWTARARARAERNLTA